VIHGKTLNAEKIMPAGRPTKYDKKFCKTVVELMKDGCSITEVAAEIGITKETIYRWKERYQEFSDAINVGTQLSEAWWERQGRLGLWADSNQATKKINYNGWYMNMRNRFGWRDKTETDLNHSGQVKTEVTFADRDEID